jgi:alpha-tubulin suppressor-like RCC1 family protein
MKTCAVAAFAFLLCAGSTQAASDNGIAQVALGENHFCAVTNAGALACWGDNKNGQIGNGMEDNRALKPVLVIETGVNQVSAGYAHTCAVVADALDCWGWNHSGHVGTGVAGGNVLVPTRVIGKGVSSVSAGGMHTCALVAGALRCWGYNEAGQIGTGSVGGNVLKPATVIASGVTRFSAGAQQTCAVVRGALLCWGENRYGQVGTGVAGKPVPEPVTVIPAGVTQVAAGPNYTCAVVNGALQCWGKINHLGIGPNGGVEPRPMQLIASGVTDVATGSAHACAIVRGALQCWGYSSVGGAGTGKWGEIITGAKEVIASGVTSVSAGQFNTCAIVNRALRCRGYSPYGQIPAMAAFELKPFDVAGGDVPALDVASASAALEAVGASAKVPNALKGRIVLHDSMFGKAASYVTGVGRGSVDIHGELALQLDIVPLMALAQDNSTGLTSDYVPAPGARCGADGLPNRLTTTGGLFVLAEEGFLGLREALRSTFPALPEIPYAGPPPGMHARHQDMLRACAKSILAAADARPFAAIRYETNQGLLHIPPTLDGSWSQPSSLSIGSITRIVVEPKPGHAGRFTVEAAVIPSMQCGTLTLGNSPGSTSRPWRVPFNGKDFDVDRRLLDNDVPEFARHTDLDLRRAIAAEKGVKELASAEETKSCQLFATGERYSIRYEGKVVQEFAVAYPTGRPMAPDSCDAELPMPALHAANNLGYPVMEFPGFATCKPSPGDPGRNIIALAFPHQAPAGASASGDGDFDLDILVAEKGSGKIVSRLQKKNALTSDAWRLSAVGIDTARYHLAPGVRAFGIRARHDGSSRVSPGGSETLDLYVERDGKILPVLSGLVVATSHGDWDGNCAGSFSETARTVRVATSSRHGFADLIVKTTRSERETFPAGDDCKQKLLPPGRSETLLRFDGAKYVVPQDLLGP